MPLLTYLIIIPLIGLLLSLVLPEKAGTKFFNAILLLSSAASLLLAIGLYANWFPMCDCKIENGYSWVENHQWFNFQVPGFGSFNARYLLGVDGISKAMVLLSGIVLFLGSLASLTITKQVKLYTNLFLLLSSAVYGSFLALDILLFYVFFEFMLLPMFFLIGIFGGARREYASLKFFIYTLVGSLLILVPILMSAFQTIDPAATGEKITPNEVFLSTKIQTARTALTLNTLKPEQTVHTFTLWHLSDSNNLAPDSLIHPLMKAEYLGLSIRAWMFLLFFIGFAIKIPIVPLHTWLPDAHVEAPAAISAILAGILLKIGGYGIIRFAIGVFPDQAIEWAKLIGGLGTISIVYGGLVALAQTNLKKMVAFSSVSHMGFVLLGIASFNAEGFSGAIYQMFSHGIISALLFLLVGILYQRTHNYEIESAKGLLKSMPAFSGMVIIAFFASLGMPLFSGFIAELLVLLGSFKANDTLSILYPLGAIIGIILSSAYLLWTFQRMFFGTPWLVGGKVGADALLPDLTLLEWSYTLPLAIATIAFGLYPDWLTTVIAPAIAPILRTLNP
jgi:NADH-quinone oxidoreductase subunit M